MYEPPRPRTRQLTVVAQDPSIRHKGRIVRARVDVPAEELLPGPCGYRVHVVDFDASTDTFYRPFDLGLDDDPFAEATDRELLANPHFHCQNVYALVMRTLARFEHALGRRVAWGLRYGHQLKVAPHAFADANAFYSPDDHALFFGYFPGLRGNKVFTCLSHDVVVHETTHALLDGLRERYTDPSSSDQAAFHEGFADVVALLSVFSLRDVVALVIDLADSPDDPAVIARSAVTPEKLRDSGLLGLAEEMGNEIPAMRGSALRRSASLLPNPDLYQKSYAFIEPHRRGELLVAAMLNAFVEVWASRLETLGEVKRGRLNRGRVVEEGATIADILLTMSIRALDYAPPVDVQFGDYLSALLTGDAELRPDDSQYRFREKLLASFRGYGIEPASDGGGGEPGTWKPPPPDLRYDRTHFEAMRRDPDEVFRFIWENREALDICDEAFTEVLSVRPCRRVGPDGFVLYETVAEYRQKLDVEARELAVYEMTKPEDMPDEQRVEIYGGGALVFDEYGRLKLHVHNRLLSAERQDKRLDYLWRWGFLEPGRTAFRSISNLHRQRATGTGLRNPEEW